MPPTNIWTLVFTTSALSGIVAALLSWAREWWTNKKEKAKEAAYLAMRVAVALEGHAAACRDYVETAEADFRQHQASPSTNLPPPPRYPDDGDWRTLDPRLADEALSFLNEIELAKQNSLFAMRFEGNQFHYENEADFLGMRAWSIAALLRTRYGLPRGSSFHVSAARLGAYFEEKQNRHNKPAAR